MHNMYSPRAPCRGKCVFVWGSMVSKGQRKCFWPGVLDTELQKYSI